MDEKAKYRPIEALLDAYGADRARWPEHATRALDGLAPHEFDALARQHAAFERLLHEAAARADAAPAPDALMARIAAAVPLEGRPAASAPDRIVAITNHPARNRRWARPIASPDQFAAAALLAASLVLGVFVGSSDVGRTTAAQVGALAGLSSVEQYRQTSALDDALHLYDDEDIL